MRTALLAFILSFLPLHLLLAQVPVYEQKFSVGSVPAMNIYNMAIDKEDNLYLTEMSRVVKMKNRKILLDFKVDKAQYAAGFTNSEGVYLSVVVDTQQFIYILNRKENRIEKHDQQGKLIKVFPPIVKATGDLYLSLSLHLDRNENINIFDHYNRRLFVYDSEGTLLETIILENPDPFNASESTSIAFDSQNNIYAAEITKYGWNPTAHIVKINREGKIINRFNETVLKENGYNSSFWLSINIDKNDDIYVFKSGSVYTNPISSPITIFSPTGELKVKLPIIANGGSAILFDSQNNIYHRVSSTGGGYILKFNQDYQVTETINNLRRPYEVVFDKRDNFFVLDRLKNELVKYNAGGIEEKTVRFNDNHLSPLTFTIDDKGFIYILDYKAGYSSTQSATVKKFDPEGQPIKSLFTFESSYGYYYGTYDVSAGLAVDAEGNIYVTKFKTNDTHAVAKYDQEGKLITKIGPVGKEPGQIFKPMDLSLDANGNVYVLDVNSKRIQKFSPAGKLIQQYGSFDNTLDPNEENYRFRASITSDQFGNLVVSTLIGTHLGTREAVVQHYDLTGKLIHSQRGFSPSLAFNSNGSLLAMADPDYDVVRIYAASTTKEYNIIEGNVFNDENADCVLDANEKGLKDVLIKAEPGPYFGATDATGNYKLIVGIGSYTIAPVPNDTKGKLITPTCTSDIAKDFNNYGNYTTDNNIGVNVSLSPYLTTSVSSTRRRRCFESTTKVTYSNAGFAPAENAKVYLQLPKEVELLSADKSYTRLPNGTHVFDVGTVAPGQTSVITIQDKVVCGNETIRGLTVCTKAWIASGKLPTGPIATVTGKCNEATGEVRFVIKNTGQDDMETGKLFKIYMDGKLASQEMYKLTAGDSLVLWIPAGGKTIRLEAVQPNGSIDPVFGSATVEGCKTGSRGVPVSTGLVTVLPTDNNAPDTAVECLQIVDSYDPNDKLVTPTGLTEENYTSTGAALKYKIRFQNTGTDVAYRVVVVDTLSEHLDLSTLQIGSASHNHRFDVSGKGKPVLTWTFDNIMLPDSNSNEPGSHGFIQFSINPKPDLPEKTAVENFADIFFDYNSPVRTNTTVNRIYDMPPVVDESVRLDPAEIIATPVLENFAPVAAREGNEVVLTGRKFSIEAAQNKVYFNGVAAKVTSASETKLRVLVPGKAVSGTIKVETMDGNTQSADVFEIYQPPVVTGFSPAEGVPGATIVLQGQHLTEAWLQTIKLGNQVCEVITIAENQVTIKLPETAVTAKFEAISKGGETQSSNTFVVWHQPEVKSLSAVLDKVGATIELSGINFAPAAARNKVWFNDTPAQILTATATTLMVKVPEGAKNGLVKVDTPGGTALSPVAFEVIPAPIVTDFDPLAGTVGSEVKLTGEYFLTLGQDDVITFNGEKAQILEATPTIVKVRVPRGATSGKIKVEGAGGAAFTETDFRIETLTPEQAIEVYPNPNTGNFTIRFVHADFEVQQVQLFSMLGTLVYSEKVVAPRPDNLEVKLQHAKAGMYLLHIQTERGLVVKKLQIL